MAQNRPIWTSSSRRISSLTCSSTPSDNQAVRFKLGFKPGDSSLPQQEWLTAPLGEDSERVIVLPDEVKVNPAALWDSTPPPGALSPRSSHAQRMRISRVRVPNSFSLPGSELWSVELLRNYSRDLPSIQVPQDGTVQLRKGMLAAAADPAVVPFFFYKGLERVDYSWADRLWQLLYVTAYAGVHLAVFSWLWLQHQNLAAAVGINWMLGRLSLVNCAALLLLASSGRVWMYWLFEAGRLIDTGLSKSMPGLRKFFWANFALWMLYIALSPGHWYPLPFAPFAPGAAGPAAAFQ